ncbi:MAG: GNAT family N-acetyltransferase [Desulfobacteraceae bacterium]|nr:GNAT family N-acetyltransferase [Desulfobacteraceae bacterium]MBU4001189.1 GNAT family N-acetyltransferase [Pseudomonadota bacterium]MBU4053319.1 GNAT family N-acetyltransferase [Pseudomonadota bacterium]
MEIRELKTNELGMLLALYRHLHDRDDPLPAQEVLDDVWNRIQEDKGHRIFGLFINDQLICSCVLVVIPNLTRGFRPYGLIENVVTHSKFRNRGLGKVLLKHALEDAWGLNCYKVMLLTGRKDEAVYRFYEAAGFDRNAKQAFLAKPR